MAPGNCLAESSPSANNWNDMNKNLILTMFRVVVGFWLLLTLSACDGRFRAPSGTDTARESLQSVQRELAIVGYNYTAKYIDSFDVGPVGGGNIHLSSETGGGGGIVCCYVFHRDVGPRTVNVKWPESICRYNVRTFSNGATSSEFHDNLRNISVEIATPIPDHPQFLEIHFYPDGTVQAAITEALSPPRIILSKSRGKPTPICPNNIKPG